MAESSIFADFSIQTQKQAEAFFQAYDKSVATSHPKRKTKAHIVSSKKEITAICKKLLKIYG